MTKKIFKLWNEVRTLRREVKNLHKSLSNLEYQLRKANKRADDYKKRWLETGRGASVFMFAVPQSNVFMRPYKMASFPDPCAEAYYAERRVAEMTDKMKIYLFDELLKEGFIKKYEPTPEETRYELRALRSYE